MSLYKQYFKFGLAICTFSVYGYYKKQYNTDKQKSLIQLKLDHDERRFNLLKDYPI
jgi:hypothetical protein